MQIWSRKSKGVLLVALINGLAGGMSLQLAIQIYKRWGWSLFGSMAVILAVLLLAISPLTWRITRRSSDETDPCKSVDAGK